MVAFAWQKNNYIHQNLGVEGFVKRAED